MPEVFVGIGSNVEPERNLREALDELDRCFGRLTVSSVYRSRAFGFDGDDFLNMVVGFTSALPAAEIDRRLSAIEYAGGRVRGTSRYAPRTLDLDLLIYGGSVDPAQRLPRDEVGVRPFVLGPLAEIAPELVHPVGGYRIVDAWHAMGKHAALERIGSWTELRHPESASPADAAAAVDG